MNLTKSQEKILLAPEDKIAINACAASMKTSTLIERIRYQLRTGTPPEQICAITYTKMAAAELIQRLGNDYKAGLFIGTIHSLAANLLYAHGYGEIMDKPYMSDDEKYNKMISFCIDKRLRQNFEWLFLDEAQDTGKEELKFIFEILNPQKYFVVFDVRQTIYQFKGADPQLLLSYLKDATFYQLNENYRNSKEILDMAKWVAKKIQIEDNSICKFPNTGLCDKIKYDKDKIANVIKNNAPLKEWAILCRTNSQVNIIEQDLINAGIPVASFKQSELTLEDLDKMMKEESVKVLTIHSSKGLAWDNVIVYGMRWNDESEIRLNYVAVTRARKILLNCTGSLSTKKRGLNKMVKW